MPATLDINKFGQLVYLARAGRTNDVSIGRTFDQTDSNHNLIWDGAGGLFAVNDPGDIISLTTAAKNAGWSGDGTQTVMGPLQSFTAIKVSTLDGSDTIDVKTFIGILGTLDGGSGIDTLIYEPNPSLLELSNGTLNSDGGNRFTLAGFAKENAIVLGVGTADVSGWTGTADVTAFELDWFATSPQWGALPPNTANLTLTSTSAALASLTVSTGGKFTLHNVAQAQLTAGTGNNKIDASLFLGPTTLAGGAGNDTLLGGSGDDSLDGGTGNDSLVGNAGNDTLRGGLGTNTLFGDATNSGTGGTDINEVAETADLNFLLTNGTGSKGGAKVLFGPDTNVTTNLNTDFLKSNIETAFLKGGDGTNFFDVSGWTANNQGVTGNVTLDGGGAIFGGNDEVVDTNNADFVLTDTLLRVVQNGQDISRVSLNDFNINRAHLTCATGNVPSGQPHTLDASNYDFDAWLVGGNGADTILGSGGNDTLVGLGGADSIVAGGSSDILDGGDGNDTLIANSGGDTLTGGTGKNTLDGGTGGGNDVVSEWGAFNFTIKTTDPSTNSGTVTFGPNQDTFTNIEQARLTVVDPSAASKHTIDGTLFTGDETLIGGNGNDTLLGGPGSDSLDGGAGNDSLNSGNGTNTLTGGLGQNTLTGGTNTDFVVETGDFDYTLTNSLLTFFPTGKPTKTPNSDSLPGNVSSSTSIGHAILIGGPSGNTFNVGAWPFLATLIGGQGVDQVVAIEDSSMNLTATSLTVGGNGPFTLSSIDQAILVGGAGNNSLNASTFTGSTILIGGGGNDALTGGKGRNILIGGSGTDQLTAGNNQDILVGGITTYDNETTNTVNIPTLDLIMTTWNGTAAYASRVASLGTRFNKNTVMDDTAVDTLTGSTVGLDWFISSVNDVLQNFNPKTEKNTVI